MDLDKVDDRKRWLLLSEALRVVSEAQQNEIASLRTELRALTGGLPDGASGTERVREQLGRALTAKVEQLERWRDEISAQLPELRNAAGESSDTRQQIEALTGHVIRAIQHLTTLRAMGLEVAQQKSRIEAVEQRLDRQEVAVRELEAALRQSLGASGG